MSRTQLTSLISGLLAIVLGFLVSSGGFDSLAEDTVLPNGSVIKVVDGDTVDVMINNTEVRVRLLGIDTPEVVDPRKPVQCFGKEASEHLHQLLDGQTVTLEYDESQGITDKYGRQLAYVLLNGEKNMNEQMLRDGFAYEYTYRDAYKYQLQFLDAEREARDSQKGLWSSETCGGQR
jgi:micrococcal nuclease